MNTTNHGGPNAHLVDALSAADPSGRLGRRSPQATPRSALTDILVDRCAVEPNSSSATCYLGIVPLPDRAHGAETGPELGSDTAQARSQSLHTLSKIGDRRPGPPCRHCCTTSTTRSRAARGGPPWHRAARRRGGPRGRSDDRTRTGRSSTLQLSLSRALVGLGDAVLPVLVRGRDESRSAYSSACGGDEAALPRPRQRVHLSVETAKRVAVTGPDA